MTSLKPFIPFVLNFIIIIQGLIWSEIKQLWDVGLEEYVRDMWNVIDFITNSLYVATVALRVVSYYKVRNILYTTKTKNTINRLINQTVCFVKKMFALINSFN